jgi:hypothetical protein
MTGMWRLLSCLLGVALVALGACGGDGDDPAAPSAGAIATTDESARCDYSQDQEPRPHPANRVIVSGGATCDEGKELFLHPAPDEHGEGGTIDPAPLEGWICDQEATGPGGPDAFDCSSGAKRVDYLFH